MHLRIHRLAVAEIDREVDYYESRQSGLGRELEDDIDAAFSVILRFGTMIVVPALGGDKNILPSNRPGGEYLPHRIADGLFIAIALRAVEVSKPQFQGRPGGLLGRQRIRNQCAEAERRHGRPREAPNRSSIAPGF